MSFIQFVIFIFGLNSFRILIFGKNKNKENITFKDTLLALINCIVGCAISYYSLKYTLPIFIKLVKGVI